VPAFLVGALACGGAGGEIKKSQHATVTQRVGRTEISLVYNRPVARGRRLFGGIVPWGQPWNPGADDATTITVSRDVRVNGAPLPAGTKALPSPSPDGVSFALVDLGSSNGSFLRIRNEIDLIAGDHFRVGQQLFRVDFDPSTQRAGHVG